MKRHSQWTRSLGCLVLILLLMPMLMVRAQAPDVTASVGEEMVLASSGQGPTISPVRVQTPGAIEKYAKFEVAFDIANTVASNFYFPYDPAAPAGVQSGIGISVDALILAPGLTDWGQAKVAPCFYYQPVEEMGSGDNAQLLPVGKADWRLRFTPETPGVWQYRLRAQDALGTTLSGVEQFSCVDSSRRGFVRVSQTDPRLFEFSDGTPFVYPLINAEDGSPFNGLNKMRASIQTYGQNGVRFVRWFPTGEGANFDIIPWGDDIRSTWCFGTANTTYADVDTAAGKRFSFTPYYYSQEYIPAVPGGHYRLTLRAKVTGDMVLRPEIDAGCCDVLGGIDICANPAKCSGAVAQGWDDYTIEITNTGNAPVISVWLHDNNKPRTTPGNIYVHSVRLQRDETGRGDWGPNLLSRSDPDTFAYVDQPSAARLDELMRLSEQYGVYHKLTLFHKNDALLNQIQADGSTGPWYQCSWGGCPNNFYSADGQAARWYENSYTRYFVARWSYSTALHSLELGNENDLDTESYNAGFAVAQLVQNLSPRHVMMSNSFWGWFVDGYWADPGRGNLMDYADKHWYANPSGASGSELISNIVNDSAANVRQTELRFRQYREQTPYNKPIVRGETGAASQGTGPQIPDLARDPQCTYYHKQLWAMLGGMGFQFGGEWYPHLLTDNNQYGIYAAWERFMAGEPVNNGHYDEIGTDLAASANISATSVSGSLRAWGVRDATNGRVLLWIDNASNTWRNVVDGVAMPPAGATLTIAGLPQGSYTAEWWDTRTGSPTNANTLSVGADGNLTLTVSDVATDKALKLKRVSDAQATATNTVLPAATNTPLPTATNTALPTATNTPLPTATSTALPTATNTPLPTATNTALPTATNTPLPTATNTALPTATNTPLPTTVNTAQPTATNTPLPTATETAQPTATATDVPTATPSGVLYNAPTLRLGQFGSLGQAGGWTSQDTYPRMLGDVNGDGKTDVVGFAAAGTMVSLSDGTALSLAKQWVRAYGRNAGGWSSQNTYPRALGDVNGDGKADVVGFGNTGVSVSLSTGSSFTSPSLWLRAYGSSAGGWRSQTQYPRFVGDVNGDGKADIVGFGGAGVYVSLSTGKGFTTPALWLRDLGYNQGWTSQQVLPRFLADVNGDGKIDIVALASDGVYVALSQGNSFAPLVRWSGTMTRATGWTSLGVYPRIMADADGDGKADMVGMAGNDVYLSAAKGDRFDDAVLVLTGFGPGAGWGTDDKAPRAAGDLDRDLKAELVVFGPEGVYVATEH